MTVKDIMVRDVITLSPDMTALDAMRTLMERSISGLPVVDADGFLKGMFTEKEIIAYVLPHYIGSVGTFVYEENPRATKKKFDELATVKVSQIMRRNTVTAVEDTAVRELARIMLTQKARRIPVVDKAGKVIGIVARNDIMRALAKEAQRI